MAAHKGVFFNFWCTRRASAGGSERRSTFAGKESQRWDEGVNKRGRQNNINTDMCVCTSVCVRLCVS